MGDAGATGAGLIVDSTTTSSGTQETLGRRTFAVPGWLRNPAGAIVVAAFVFGLLSVITLLLEIGRPFGGYTTYGFIGNSTVEMTQETPEWWLTWGPQGPNHDDEFLTINGRPYYRNMWNEMAWAYERGEAVTVTFHRPGVEKEFTFSLKPRLFTLLDFLDLRFPDLLIGLVFWLLAVIVLHAGPDLTLNRVFAAAMACVAVSRLTTLPTLASDYRLLPNISRMVYFLASGLLTALIFHLAFLFPTPLRKMPVRLLHALYGVAILSGIVMAAARTPFWAAWPEDLDRLIDYYTIRVMMLMLLGSIVTLFARLVRVWLTSGPGNRREKRVAQIVLVGLILALPPILIIFTPFIPGLARSVPFFMERLDLRYFLLAVPIAFALAIIRYHTFRTPSPLFIFVIVLSTSALLATFAVAVWGSMQPDGFRMADRPLFEVVFTFYLLAGVFWSRQATWRGWFGRLLHRSDRNFESARSFGNRVMSRTPLQAMPETIATALVDELGVERAAVWAYDANAGTYDLSGAAGGVEPSVPLRLFAAPTAPVPDRVVHTGWTETPAWLGRPAAEGRIEVIAPLKINQQMIGLLGVGRRWDEDIFDERDLAVIELVGQQVSLFMQASMQIEELRLVPARVAVAQEQERYRLAGELHDTIQQFLGRLPFFLATSRDMMATDQAEATAILERCLDDVEEASIVLREIRANLAPNQLSNSLVVPLNNLAGYIERRMGLKVCLDLPDGLDEATTADTRHALYRVIRQATDNAVAHAEATEIIITLGLADGRVLFAVRDDGRGVEQDELAGAVARGSFGLQSMEARVKAVNGEYVFTSAEGQGTTVSGWVPAAR